jgi:2OG-Fe(II) oxygenase superfamily
MKIIDDVIPPSIQNELERNILDPRFPWGHMLSSDLANSASDDYVVLKRKEFKENNIIDPGQFYHNILNEQQPGQFFSWFTPILDAIKHQDMRILRMKMNFNYPWAGISDSTHGIPHVDLPNEKGYTTAIYYVTNADGDTILFNEKNGHQGPLTIKERISPKKGRIVLFDGATLHAGCPPISNSPRIVVNINIR